MIKLFKYAILGLLMLDVAVLPFSCFGPQTNEGELYIWFETTTEGTWEGLALRDFVIEDVEEGYVITEDDIRKIVVQAIDETKVKSYEVVKYSLVDGSDIDMPYTVTDEAICTYHYGVRNAFNINVYLKLELYEEGETNV